MEAGQLAISAAPMRGVVVGDFVGPSATIAILVDGSPITSIKNRGALSVWIRLFQHVRLASEEH